MGVGGGINCKRAPEMFGCDRNVLCLDCGGGNMIVYICYNSLDCNLIKGEFNSM